MEITKSTIKALASDTRLEILKILSHRRKIAADLAKMLDLAPSTVNGHLKILEEEGLIKRKETGHKWIYFEITERGKSLVKPRSPMQFVLILSIGVLAMIVGGFKSLRLGIGEMRAMGSGTEEFAIKTTQDVAGNVPPPSGGVDWMMVFLIVIGISLVCVSAYNLWKIRKEKV